MIQQKQSSNPDDDSDTMFTVVGWKIGIVMVASAFGVGVALRFILHFVLKVW